MGKYHCTIDLLSDWFGISCMMTGNFCFYLQDRLIQTSQTGGQWYSDTSPLEFPVRAFQAAPMPLPLNFALPGTAQLRTAPHCTIPLPHPLLLLLPLLLSLSPAPRSHTCSIPQSTPSSNPLSLSQCSRSKEPKHVELIFIHVIL